MEIDQATAELLLEHAERQTKSLESLYNLAWVWTLLVVAGIVIGIVIAANN